MTKAPSDDGAFAVMRSSDLCQRLVERHRDQTRDDTFCQIYENKNRCQGNDRLEQIGLGVYHEHSDPGDVDARNADRNGYEYIAQHRELAFAVAFEQTDEKGGKDKADDKTACWRQKGSDSALAAGKHRQPDNT